MSSIPPTWIASGVQALGSQQRAASERDRIASDADRAAAESPFAKLASEMIEALERDDQVHSDGEGYGSQGRSPSDTQPETSKSATEDAGNSRSNSSGCSVDLEA